MRICVLQFSYEGPDRGRGDLENGISRFEMASSQHTFERRIICEESFKEKIDSVLREGFDFYINLWSTTEDPGTGMQASQYFESLDVPSAGFCSRGQSWIKDSLYKHARQRGAPCVPGMLQFPLSVKPSNGYISQPTDENYVCHDERELRDVLCQLDKQLSSSGGRRIDACGPTASAELHDLIDRYSDDIVIQEFIDGDEYTVTVIELGDSAVALHPCVKTLSGRKRFHTSGAGSDLKPCKELVNREDNPILFQSLQHAALEAFEAGMFRGSHMGCEVNLRVNGEMGVFVTIVNSQAMTFLQTRNDLQDLLIESLPGGLPAAVNVFIANYYARHDVRQKECIKVATAYDEVAPEYDDQGQTNSQDKENFRHLVENYDFQGTVLDLACGTGFFGRLLAENGFRNAERVGSLIGFDLSPGMVDLCRKTGVYDQVDVSRLQTCLLQYYRHGEVDHVVSFGALHFLSPEEFASFFVQCFIIANKSITVSVDEIPDSYNEHLHEKGLSHMHSINHLGNMEAFGEPQGWKLVSSQRHYSWTSPTTGDGIYSTFFRFERVDRGNVLISRAPEKN